MTCCLRAGKVSYSYTIVFFFISMYRYDNRDPGDQRLVAAASCNKKGVGWGESNIAEGD